MKEVYISGSILKKGSTALELFDKFQSANGEEKQKAKKKFDSHMKEVNSNYNLLHGEFPQHLKNFKIGADDGTQQDQTVNAC